MIDLYYWTTPNGHKVTIFLEEAGLDYRIVPINIGAGDQFSPEFLEISPNNKIPAIVDRMPSDGGEPLILFESGAILLYLAEKARRFLPIGVRLRHRVQQWVFWQMGGFGPMLGQNHHFSQYAPEKVPYAIERYRKETERLYGVLDEQLGKEEFVAGAYSIADMAIYPWVVPHEKQGIDLREFGNLARWFRTVGARPAVIAAYARAKEVSDAAPVLDDKAKRVLFGQGRRGG